MMALKNQRGHTLVELLVAMVIGLLMVLAAFTVMAKFEGHKRTTTALNDALQSGNYGLYQLSTFGRSAGTGIVQMDKYAFGCALNYQSGSGTTISGGTMPTLAAPFDKMFTTPSAVKLRLAPAIVFPASLTGKSSDALMVLSGGSGFGESPVRFTAPAVAKQLQLTNTVGFFANDWVLISQNAVNPAATGDCMVTRVDGTYVAETAANSTGNVALSLTQSSVGSTTLASYAGNAMISDLGNGNGSGASFLLYAVDDTAYALKSIDLLSDPTTSQFVADDVVTMRVVYGINTVGPGALTWVLPVNSGGNQYAPASLLDGTNAARTRLQSIRAIRIAIIVRAPLQERWDANDVAINSATNNTINQGTYHLFSTLPAAVQMDWTVPTGQENFRYRVLEATLPLRNAAF